MASDNTIVSVPGTISPKVLNPALVLLGIGLLLIILGVIVDEDQLKTIGYAALGSAVPTFATGYLSKPGQTMTLFDPGRPDAGMPDSEGAGPGDEPIIEKPPTGEAGYISYDVLALLLAVAGIVLILVADQLLFGVILLVVALFAVIGTRGFGPRRR